MSISCSQIQSCFVTDLSSVFEALTLTGLVKDKNGGGDSYALFSKVEETKEYIKIGVLGKDGGSIIGHLILIKNESICKNSPVYIYVDNINKFNDYITRIENSSSEEEVYVDRFVGRGGTSKMLLHFGIASQCDICILEDGKDNSSVNLITEWSLSCRANSLSSLSKNGHSPTRTKEEVIMAAEEWHVKSVEESINSHQSSSSDADNNTAGGWASARGGGTSSKSKSSKRTEVDPNLMSEEEFSQFYGRRLPQLFFSVLNRDNKYRDFTCNSPLPVPFRNESFDGKLLLMVNTTHKSLVDTEYVNAGPDLYEPRFEGTKYTFDIQVQGKFVKIPNGHIYFGAECSEKLDLNWLYRKISDQVMGIAKGFNNNASGSIGEENELPHTTAPLWSTLDALIITPGKNTDRSAFKNQVTFTEKPPQLGDILKEDPELRNARRKNHQFVIPIDLETVYTFSFMSTQLELMAWRITNIPFFKTMNISSFFNQADINMVCYTVPFGTPQDNAGKFNGDLLPTRHFQSDVQYLLKVRVQHLANHPEFIEQKRIGVGLDHVPQKLDENHSNCNDALSNDDGENSDDEDNFQDIPIYVAEDEPQKTPRNAGVTGGGAGGGSAGTNRRQSARKSFSLIKDDSEIEWANYYGRRIPNLYMKIKTRGEYRPITANSPAPIPFCNEYMEGRILFMINTNHKSNRMDNQTRTELGPDLYESRFEGTKFTYDIQVQAKFLKKPRGNIFFGFEATKKMNLGKLTSTNAFYQQLLSLGRKFNPNLHWSFGDSQDEELPHVVAPLWHAVDTLIITPGENCRAEFTNVTITNTPPAFGGIFVEDPAVRQIRRRDFNFRVPIDLDTIYSCSFKSAQVELISWKWNTVPILGKIDLHSFFDDADLRFCCYAVPYDGTDHDNWGDGEEVSVLDNKYLPRKHIQNKLIQLLSIEVQHKSNHKEFKDRPVGTDKSPPLLNIKKK